MSYQKDLTVFLGFFASYPEAKLVKEMSEELKNLLYSFYCGQFINRCRIIRKIENLSEWRLAAELWGKLDGYEEDKNACNMLAAAIEAGDRLRSEY
jgi:hypothetical protein